MPDNTTIRKYIRHPSDVPIKVMLDLVEDADDDSDDTLTNVSLGGLSFISSQAIEAGQKVSVCIPILQQDNYLAGDGGLV